MKLFRDVVVSSVAAGCSMVLAANATAGSFNLAGSDINVSGGVAGAYHYTTANGATNGKDNDGTSLSDLVFEVDSGDVKAGSVGFKAGIGGAAQNTVTTFGPDTASAFGMGFLYASVIATPIDKVSIEVGRLATTIGAESAISFANHNITRGLLWSAQPTFYDGVRVGFDAGVAKVFAEVNDGAVVGTNSIAIGATVEANNISLAATYLDEQPGVNIIDAVVNLDAGGIDVGANIDVIMIDNAAGGRDDNAFGLAVFAVPKLAQNFTLPVRVEYGNGGTSGVWDPTGAAAAGKDVNPISFTVTPTLAMGSNGFLRGELSFVKMGEKIFGNEGKAGDTDLNVGVALQAGMTF